MGLAGKFIFHMGEEYSRQGEIVEQISDEIILIRFEHSCGMPPTLSPISVKSLVTAIDDPDLNVEIFNTRAEMMEFLDWLETPSDKSENAEGATVN